MKSKKISVLVGVILLAAIAGAIQLVRKHQDQEEQLSEVRIQLAYPIKLLDPTHSKDWETVSINNHIFHRLIETEYAPKTPFIAPRVDFVCTAPAGAPVAEGCQTVQISFAPKPLEDCMGRKYSVQDIQGEFERIIKATPWILPKSQPCNDGPAKVCLSGVYRPDIQRRMHSVTLRFGWSKQTEKDPLFGSGPYCLTAKQRTDQGITEGVLTPKGGFRGLPEIKVFVSQDPKDDFNFALYGSKKLLAGTRKNVQAHTPIGYYVVTNPALVKFSVPWNLESTRKRISETFLKEEVYFPIGSNIDNIFPAGAAVLAKDERPKATRKLEFVLPDYLPKCKELSEELTSSWKASGATAVCKDIVSFVYNHVWNKKRDWDGFIVGVTQHDPGRNTVGYEYFSPDSPDSWIYDYPEPPKLYYLSGVGQSLVTVDGKRFCGLKPNIFGLGDIFITDLIPCGRE